MAIWVNVRMNRNIGTYKCYLKIFFGKIHFRLKFNFFVVCTTSGESNGYLLLNLKSNWKFSPSYNVPTTPAMWIFHLKISTEVLMVLYWCNNINCSYCVKFCPTLSVSTWTPGGGSFINDISSFWSRLCK